MPYFRKLPIVVEAEELIERHVVQTLDGSMVGEPGDWLITGESGQQYPVKPSTFVATYEQVVKDADGCWVPVELWGWMQNNGLNSVSEWLGIGPDPLE